MEKVRNSLKQRSSTESQTTLLAKNPPVNLDAERAVLAALLLNDDYVVQVSEVLMAGDFYTVAHRLIYQAIVDLSQASKRIDMVTLQDELVKRNQLDAIGGMMYLLSLQEDIPAVGMIKQHASIVKEKAILRELIGSASEIIERCYAQNDEGIEGVIDHAEKKIFHIADKRSPQHFVQLDIWLKKTFQHLSDKLEPCIHMLFNK